MTSKASLSDVPVIILCGGGSSRIRDLTLDKPKAMLEVGGMPILWHIMKIYSHYGFNKFVLTLGYQGDYIRDYFESEQKVFFRNFNVILAETGLNTANGARVLRCKPYIDSDVFLCTYGDGVSNLDIFRLYNFHLRKGVIGTITGVRINHNFGIIKKSKNGLLLSYRKGHPMENLINGGFMVFSKEYLKYLRDGDEGAGSEIEEPFGLLAKKRQMAVYHHPGFWGAFDTFKDLAKLKNHWKNGKPWKVWSD
jgi:glucose-1-phosphate cytidylyltransferase